MCLRLLHSTVATKGMCGRKFLHQVVWHSLMKLCTKIMKIHLYLQNLQQKNQWHLFYSDMVYTAAVQCDNYAKLYLYITSIPWAGLKMPIHAHFFRRRF